MEKQYTVKIVIGANYGDCGKGLAVDYFSAQSVLRPLNVLANGGPQRAHTVVLPGGLRHVFHHFGSGTLSGADTFLASRFLVNPMEFMRELRELANIAPMARFLVFADPVCPLTTPFDMATNQILESTRGDGRYGSCGMGIWETIVRNGPTLGVWKRLARKERKALLESIREGYFPSRLHENGLSVPAGWEFLFTDALLERYLDDMDGMFRTLTICGPEILRSYRTIVFENGQGLLLEQGHGDDNHATPSYTGLRNPAAVLREVFNGQTGGLECADVEICYVSRTYMTRHGAGPLYDEISMDKLPGDMRIDKTNIENPFQGQLRYAPLDTEALYKRTVEDFSKFALPGWRQTHFFTHADENPDIPIYATYVSYGPCRTLVNTLLPN